MANALILPSNVSLDASEVHWFLLAEARWIPAVLIGLGIAWCGIGTVPRVAATLSGLLVVLAVPALFAAVGAAVGTRVLAGYPAEMLGFGLQGFGAALGPQGESPAYLALTVIVAALGLMLHRLLEHQAS
jgi:hypothetical protein